MGTVMHWCEVHQEQTKTKCFECHGPCSNQWAGYVAVPVVELKKLEECRVELYAHLGEHVGSVMLHDLTQQIWKVANTKKWG